MKVQTFFPVTLVIDGEKIVIRIKRMNMEEHSDFKTRLAKVGTPTITRFVSRKSSGPEQAQNNKGEFTIPFEEIALKRLEELEPEKRIEFEACVVADEKEAKVFLSWMCEQFVTVERGLIEETADGKEQSITDGLDFLRIFGARQDVLQQTLAAVQSENELNLEQKKTWRSPAVSSSTSKGRRRVRTGQKPKTIARNAGSSVSPRTEDAKPSLRGRSGSTERLSSTRARSLE